MTAPRSAKGDCREYWAPAEIIAALEWMRHERA